MNDNYEIHAVDAVAYDDDWYWNGSTLIGHMTAGPDNVETCFRSWLESHGYDPSSLTFEDFGDGQYELQGLDWRPIFGASIVPGA